MNQVIIEVGSTCTKVDWFDGVHMKRIHEFTIFFKQHYHINQRIDENDFKQLVEIVNQMKEKCPNIFVCGTSIFRFLSDNEKKEFKERFKVETGCEFFIISQEEENRLTVFGATRNVKEKVCVFVGGGGSTEISIYDGEIKESADTNFGAMDIMEQFPNLGDDIASTPLDEVTEYIKKRLHLPKQKADILILAGGGHEKFARYSGIEYEANSLYSDDLEPIMMDIHTRIIETRRYFEEISLDERKKNSSDPNWWYATRAMCALVLVVAEAVEAKYIVPTNIGMAHGILENFHL